MRNHGLIALSGESHESFGVSGEHRIRNSSAVSYEMKDRVWNQYFIAVYDLSAENSKVDNLKIISMRMRTDSGDSVSAFLACEMTTGIVLTRDVAISDHKWKFLWKANSSSWALGPDENEYSEDIFDTTDLPIARYRNSFFCSVRSPLTGVSKDNRIPVVMMEYIFADSQVVFGCPRKTQPPHYSRYFILETGDSSHSTISVFRAIEIDANFTISS